MSALGAFQSAFADALRAGPGERMSSPLVEPLAAQPGFAVYRNTVTKGWVDALEANFPAVVAIVGQEWFLAAATVYARRHPPADALLASYGGTFPLFLARFAPAAEMPYLPHVAALDRLWIESAFAETAVPLGAVDVALIEVDALAAAAMRLHPAVGLIWLEMSAVSIWLDARGLEPAAAELIYEKRGEGLLLARPFEEVAALRLTIGGYRLVERLAAGEPFGAAAMQALMAEPELEMASVFANLLKAGAFSSVELAAKAAGNG